MKYLAFALMTLVGVLGLVFAAGYAFSDLESTQAVGTTAPWLVLTIALSAFCLEGKGAFRRFKNALYQGHPELISAWHVLRGAPGTGPGRAVAG